MVHQPSFWTEWIVVHICIASKREIYLSFIVPIPLFGTSVNKHRFTIKRDSLKMDFFLCLATYNTYEIQKVNTKQLHKLNVELNMVNK